MLYDIDYIKELEMFILCSWHVEHGMTHTYGCWNVKNGYWEGLKSILAWIGYLEITCLWFLVKCIDWAC